MFKKHDTKNKKMQKQIKPKQEQTCPNPLQSNTNFGCRQGSGNHCVLHWRLCFALPFSLKLVVCFCRFFCPYLHASTTLDMPSYFKEDIQKWIKQKTHIFCTMFFKYFFLFHIPDMIRSFKTTWSRTGIHLQPRVLLTAVFQKGLPVRICGEPRRSRVVYMPTAECLVWGCCKLPKGEKSGGKLQIST